MAAPCAARRSFRPAAGVVIRRRLPQLGAVGALAILGGAQFERVFGWAAIAGPVIAAGVVSVALVGLVSGLGRRGAAAGLLVSVAGLVLLAAVAVFDPSADGLREIGDGLRNGWARILSTTVPAEPEPSMVLVPVVLTWWAGWAAAELVLRARSAWAPLVPPVLVATVGFAFGVPAGSAEPALTGLTVAVAFLLVALRADALRADVRAGDVRAGRADVRAGGAGPRLDARARRSLAGLPLVALVAVAAAAVAPGMPTRGRPFDPRAHRTVAPPERPVLNPVDQVKSRLSRPAQPMFTVRLSGAPPDRLAQVVLDRYDGRTWSTDDRYITTGRELPPAEPTTAPTRRVGQDIRIGELDGIWLPVAARPVELTGTPFQFAPDHGVVVSSARTLAGIDYRVVSEVAEPTEEQLSTAEFATNPVAVSLPQPVPPAVLDAAGNIAPPTAAALERVRSLETFLQARMKAPENPADAPTGHAYGNLTYLLDEATSGSEGTSEQFATLFAVLARVNGIPARVVAGFRLPEPSPDGTYEVRAGDAHVWPEVEFEGIGWVAFDPSPNAAAAARQSEREQAGSDRELDEPVVVDVPSTTTTSPKREPAAVERGGGFDPGWLLALPASALAALTVPPLLKRLRRRSGRRGPPERRVGGAWADVVDRMVEAGVPVPPSASVTDVVAAGATAFGPGLDRHLEPLAGLVNHSIFGRRPPDEAVADRAWGHADDFRKGLNRQLGPWRRCRAALDLRPFTRQRGGGHTGVEKTGESVVGSLPGNE